MKGREVLVGKKVDTEGPSGWHLAYQEALQKTMAQINVTGRSSAAHCAQGMRTYLEKIR